MGHGFLIFHLNLAFSSIPTEVRLDVIRKCYWPILQLAKNNGIPVGVELSGWTLQRISELDSGWVKEFRSMLHKQQVELIGSGWSQIIGPLVPYEVNRWNQHHGLEAYRQILGITPTLALVNEMAFSTGLVDLYLDAGYKGIIMDRDNVRLALRLEHEPLSSTPTHAAGCGDKALPVLWSDSILFQRLQRVVHGDIPVSEYMAYVIQRLEEDHAVLPIYCNDAEIFDYRPGRFTAESRLHPEGEWNRLERICLNLQRTAKLGWLSPSDALERQMASSERKVMRLSSISHPIPVKKQAKYNINRWAVSGRDNLWLNTNCHQIHQTLTRNGEDGIENWRELCELWASDLRTHITQTRWNDAVARVALIRQRLNLDANPLRENESILPLQISDACHNGIEIGRDEEGILWTISSPSVHLILNARRGLAIKSLGFKSHGFEPILGTLPQGYFKSIELGADFYSGGTLIEIPGERARLTDLEWIAPSIVQCGAKLLITAKVPLSRGTLKKTIALDAVNERITLSYNFEGFERPLGILRAGIITLIPESLCFPLTLRCVNGGPGVESFCLDHAACHANSASAFVTSTAGFGATDGHLIIEDARGRGLTFAWNPAVCAAVPMLQHQFSNDITFTRILFSLAEMDDTSRTGGRILPFSVGIGPT